MQLKDPRSCVHLRKFIVPRSHCRNVKMAENCDESEKELGDWCENGSEDREPKCSHYPMKSVARSMSIRERETAASEAKKEHGHLENQP